MAIFGTKKNTKKEVKAEAAPKKAAPARASHNISHAESKIVLLRPRITEKAANMTAVNVYAFDIAKSATKKDVKDAVKTFYKVTPLKVNVVNTPAKRVKMRRRRGFGTKAATRKAYVYLKKGEEIRFT